MPHYSDGTEAQVGDYVVGKGYNIKDETGELATIAGTIIHISPGADVCNVQVAIVRVFKDVTSPTELHRGQKMLPDGKFFSPEVESGQADHFEKVG